MESESEAMRPDVELVCAHSDGGHLLGNPQSKCVFHELFLGILVEITMALGLCMPAQQ